MHSNDSGFRWFYQQAQTKQLTGKAQRLWCYLYDRLGITHANHFYEMSSKALSQDLGVCLKSVERARKALQQAGFLHYEVRGKSVYYMLLLPKLFFLSQVDTTSATALQQNKNIVASKEHNHWRKINQVSMVCWGFMGIACRTKYIRRFCNRGSF